MRMARHFLLIPLLAALLAGCGHPASDPDIRAASALAERLLSGRARQVVFVRDSSATDSYALESRGHKLYIAGNNANSMADGLNRFLQDWCHTTVSWWARDAVRLPRRLPAVAGRVEGSARVEHRFFLNYCTYGYTLAWWRWEDWERLIDWMALNGVTMALAQTGQEAVWQRVWRQFGLDDGQIRAYFTGPAFLPWHRMTNIDAWDGPLPQGWIDGQAELQQRILAREQELGITPILSAFNGHVPEALRAHFPEADIRQLGGWSRFPQEYICWYLDPRDPLFADIQRAFLQEQKALYGTPGHIYGVDPFNEVDPPSWDPDYLAGAARGTYEALAASDPQAVWLQMGWLFFDRQDRWRPELIRAYLDPVPKGRMLMLDYICERAEVWRSTEGFFGQDFIWSYLGNFGGTTMMTGDFDEVSGRLDRAYADAGANFTGIGCTLEGFGVNPFMYEYVLGRAWTCGGDDAAWIRSLADRHAGFEDAHNRRAWEILCHKVYRTVGRDRATMLTARPNLAGTSKWGFAGFAYDNRDLLEAWGELLQSVPSDRAEYRFDCVNLARQCLDNHFGVLFRRALAAYAAADPAALAAAVGRMLEILDDVAALVGADPYFRLDRQVAAARSFGQTPQEQDYYERDARRILSTWGPRGGSLYDYSQRSYDGMLSTYARPRWERFLQGLQASLESGVPFDYPAFLQWCFDFEWAWPDAPLPQAAPPGDGPALSRALYDKYAPEIAGQD